MGRVGVAIIKAVVGVYDIEGGECDGWGGMRPFVGDDSRNSDDTQNSLIIIVDEEGNLTHGFGYSLDIRLNRAGYGYMF